MRVILKNENLLISKVAKGHTKNHILNRDDFGVAETYNQGSVFLI